MKRIIEFFKIISTLALGVIALLLFTVSTVFFFDHWYLIPVANLIFWMIIFLSSQESIYACLFGIPAAIIMASAILANAGVGIISWIIILALCLTHKEKICQAKTWIQQKITAIKRKFFLLTI